MPEHEVARLRQMLVQPQARKAPHAAGWRASPCGSRIGSRRRSWPSRLEQVERVHEDVVAFALPATALDHLKPATPANEAERFSGPFGLIRVANKDACTAKSLKWRASVARCLRTPPQVAKPLDFRWPLDAAYATAASLMPLSLALRMARLGLSTATSTGIEPISPPSKEVPPTPHGGGAGYCPRV
jgi:hypothetical protein